VAAGFVLQTLGLYLRGRAVKGCPIGNTFEIFQFTAWSAIALYLVVGATFRLSLLGYFTSCLSAVLTLLSLANPVWDATRHAAAFGGNAWVEFHAALALFSYGVFALLALTSGMYLLQTYSLKHKHLHGLFSFLPSISSWTQISVRLLVVGVVLMTWSLGSAPSTGCRTSPASIRPNCWSPPASGWPYSAA
jgi:HemX protein